MWSGKKAHMHFVVKGRGLALEKIERAIAFEVGDTTAAEAGTR
jgi:hypothetical protein